MTDQNAGNSAPQEPEDSGNKGVAIRAGMQAVGGAIPFAGGVLSAIAGVWGEQEQKKAYEFLKAWIQMLECEMREKQRVITEIITRIDLQNEEIAKRVRSDEYQQLMRKAFRNWAGAESLRKQDYIRNVLSNAASATLVSDDVISLFIEWLQKYSEFHFAVIGAIFNHTGSTRSDIWQRLGRQPVREDSADADLFKLLMRDLSTGGVIRQERPTDYAGNFIKKTPPKTRGPVSRTTTSAFDDEDVYVLTALGQQFVHYAMTELVPMVEYQGTTEENPPANKAA